MRRAPAEEYDLRQNPDPEQRQPRRAHQGQRKSGLHRVAPSAEIAFC